MEGFIAIQYTYLSTFTAIFLFLASINLDKFAFIRPMKMDNEQRAKKNCLTVVDVFELLVLQLQSSSSSLAPEHHDHGGDEDDHGGGEDGVD